MSVKDSDIHQAIKIVSNYLEKKKNVLLFVDMGVANTQHDH